jgi:hypothetical protein
VTLGLNLQTFCAPTFRYRETGSNPVCLRLHQHQLERLFELSRGLLPCTTVPDTFAIVLLIKVGFPRVALGGVRYRYTTLFSVPATTLCSRYLYHWLLLSQPPTGIPKPSTYTVPLLVGFVKGRAVPASVLGFTFPWAPQCGHWITGTGLKSTIDHQRLHRWQLKCHRTSVEQRW